MLSCKSLKQSLMFNNTELYCSKLKDNSLKQPMAISCTVVVCKKKSLHPMFDAVVYPSLNIHCTYSLKKSSSTSSFLTEKELCFGG